MSTILRNKIADYLGKGTEIMFMGAGFNSLNEEPNAQTSSKTYINEVNSTTRITNYQPVFPYDSDCILQEEIEKLVLMQSLIITEWIYLKHKEAQTFILREK